MEIITTRQAYFRYLSEAVFKKESTRKQYNPKINNFTNLHLDEDIGNSLSTDIMQEFIIIDGNPNMALAALEHFYNFVHKSIFEHKNYDPFPINKDLIRRKFMKAEIEVGNPYLTNFDFTELFNDRWYIHLNNNNIQIALKACVAVCLGAAFDKGEIEALLLDDIEHDDKIVKVRNPFQNYNSKWISFNEELSRYIIQYLDIRKNIETDSNLFFMKIWDAKDTRGIEFDNIVWGLKKPSQFIEWVSYILKYISHYLMIPNRIYLTNLKDNTIYQYLLYTNGTGIDKLIRTYGWKQFIQSAYNKYFEESNIKEIEMSFNLPGRETTPVELKESGYFFQFPHQ